MKIFNLKYFLLFFLFIPSFLNAQCLPLDSVLGRKNAFKENERLFYVAHYKWLGIRMDVGAAQITLLDGGERNGRKIYHTVANAWSYRFWDCFFKVRDTYETKFFADNVRPLYFHRDIYEGGYVIQNFYDWNEDESINARIIKRQNELDTILPGHDCTFDILSLLYYARNVDFDALEQGAKNPVSFAIDEGIFDIYFRFIGREEKKIPKLGTYRTMKFAAKVVAGEVFTGEQELIMWVSDDANRVPLYIESPIRVGSVCGRLSRWSELKYPLDCKVK